MAANQSRRRTDLGPGPASSPEVEIDNSLPYRGAELDKNSMRLVKIQPAADESDPLVCTLTEVTFGSRPKFEALSYMWGTEKIDEPITLNGALFEVKRNLLDALRFLRGQVAVGKARQPFWIDAICINQADLKERTRQVRIMDEIYNRAATVVVWLGTKYTKYQDRSTDDHKCAEDGEEAEGSSQDSSAVQQMMVRHLRSDPYWERLWILQEIGRATKLRVCFGNWSSSWEGFMDLITLHNSDGNSGPMRLNKLRQEKYNGSHTLKRLLVEHQEAKCSEPRDKVYGLVGLASDAAEFPIDYGKSLYEVWKDTMVYMNEWDSFKDESEIVSTGGLVKSLLMAQHHDPLSQVTSKEHEDRVDSTQLLENSTSPLVFHLQAALLGCIMCVGPSANDIVSGPGELSQWKLAIQRLFREHPGEAHEERDRLLHALLESTGTDIEGKCFNRPSTVVWEARSLLLDSGRYRYAAKDYLDDVRSWTGITAFSVHQKPQQSTDSLAPVQPRLFLTKWLHRNSQWKMGIASALVQPDDLVCWVRSSRRALLVRAVGECQLRVFGTAMVTNDICSQAPDYRQRWESVGNLAKMTIQLDAETLYLLL